MKVLADPASSFKVNLATKAAYRSLAYANKKEYDLLIVGTKRATSHQERQENTIAKIVAGRKNPYEK